MDTSCISSDIILQILRDRLVELRVVLAAQIHAINQHADTGKRIKTETSARNTANQMAGNARSMSKLQNIVSKLNEFYGTGSLSNMMRALDGDVRAEHRVLYSWIWRLSHERFVLEHAQKHRQARARYFASLRNKTGVKTHLEARRNLRAARGQLVPGNRGNVNPLKNLHPDLLRALTSVRSLNSEQATPVIKKECMKLMLRFHPDKLMARGIDANATPDQYTEAIETMHNALSGCTAVRDMLAAGKTPLDVLRAYGSQSRAS